MGNMRLIIRQDEEVQIIFIPATSPVEQKMREISSTRSRLVFNHTPMPELRGELAKWVRHPDILFEMRKRKLDLKRLLH